LSVVAARIREWVGSCAVLVIRWWPGRLRGVRVRTRIRLTDAEASALGAIGSFLGSVYRRELARRVELGRLDSKTHAVWRRQRKRAVTAVSSSRWAGTITRAVEDLYLLGMRGLGAHLTGLRQRIEVLATRCAVRHGGFVAATGDDDAHRGRPRRLRGYRDANERFAKTRRLAILRDQLATAGGDGS
jgi:hypothetical protein